MDPLDKAKIREAALRNIHRPVPLEEIKERKRRSKERSANAPKKRPRKKGWDMEDEEDGLESVSSSRTREPNRVREADKSVSVAFGDGRVALVTEVQRGRVRVRVDDEEFDANLSQDLARTQQSSIAVGDLVELEELADLTRVIAVQERRSSLARPDPANDGRERVIAANIDVAVVVLSVVAPRLRPALIDRFLVALDYGGVAPVLCVNKVDLFGASDGRASVMRILEPYRALEIPCLLTSAETGEGVSELRELLGTKTCVFTGHSGVGKSTLLNALDPGSARDTGGVREGDGKGQHTTSSSALRILESGLRLIDTPGIRTFGLWKLDGEGLRRSFREFEEFRGSCRFRDCTHVHEPGCAVVAATESGAVAPARYAAYRRLLDEL